METINYSEYVPDIKGMQAKLYNESKNGKTFKKLMGYVSTPDNIIAAYDNAVKFVSKRNSGDCPIKGYSRYEAMDNTDIVNDIRTRLGNYLSGKVRLSETTRQSGKKTVWGIANMADLTIQQCILQVLDPICEAKFYDWSYGFRPQRTVEQALGQIYRIMQRSHISYAVSLQIDDIYANVNHKKLLRQLWSLGIQDTTLHQIIKQMLKAPICAEDGSASQSDKGIIQCGILMPFFLNVVLNELDWWIHSQWVGQCDIMKNPPQIQIRDDGRDRSHEYRALRRTNLKEMYIVRYADEFIVFCTDKDKAQRTMYAMTDWIEHRLKLCIAETSTGVVNLKRKCFEFMGFRIKLTEKGGKYVVRSGMSDEAIKYTKQRLKELIKEIEHNPNKTRLYKAIKAYNMRVVDTHDYFRFATHCCDDFHSIQHYVNTLIKNRLEISKSGSIADKTLAKRYGDSGQLRYVAGSAIVPVGFCKSKRPMCKKNNVDPYSDQD